MYGTAHSGVHGSDFFIIASYNNIFLSYVYDVDLLVQKKYNIYTNGALKIHYKILSLYKRAQSTILYAQGEINL